MSDSINPGEVRSLSRRLACAVDADNLYRDFSALQDTWILESADTDAPNGCLTMAGLRNCLRVECHGRTVKLHALNANGRRALQYLVTQLQGCVIVNEACVDVCYAEIPVQVEQTERLKYPGPLDVLRTLSSSFRHLDQVNRRDFLVSGIIAYDFLETFEQLPELRKVQRALPDYVFWLPDRLAIIDHVTSSCQLIAHVFGGDGAELDYHDAADFIGELSGKLSTAQRQSPPSETGADGSSAARVSISDQEFAELVTRLKKHVACGDVYQVVASREFSLPCTDAYLAYRKLCRDDPSPYMFHFRGPDFVLFGSSPETCLRVESGAETSIEVCPIAGTRPRGRNAAGELEHDLDSRIEADLLSDAKERAEHMMLVDLARNDVARVCRPGSMRVKQLAQVEKYSRVMHLVSKVCGRMQPGLDALHAYLATMNMGTLTGAPKLRAAELIRKEEGQRRDFYGGAVGYLTRNGDLDTAIVIRSATVRDGIARVRAGAGIVMDSNPEEEARETRRKAAAVLAAVSSAGMTA